MASIGIKDQAIELINDLPENADWDDLMNRIYVRQKIEAGLKDSESGNTIDIDKIRAKFNLK